MRFPCAPSLLFCLLLAGAVQPAAGFDRIYWCSKGSFLASLTDAEKQEFQAQHVQKVYWKVDDLVWRAGAWHWENFPTRQPQLAQETVPMVRIVVSDTNSEVGPFTNPEAAVARLRTVCGRHDAAPGSLALTFECPDEMVATYAGFLAALHKEVPDISVIVRAGVIASPAFPSLRASVSEFGALFYETEPAQHLMPSMPAPVLLDTARNAQLMQAWGAAGVRWRAVLPSFATLNIYGADNSWRRASHGWLWDELIFNPNLEAVWPLEKGAGGFVVTRTVQLNSQGMVAGEFGCIQFPERALLVQSLRDAQAAGACGAVFLIPESGKDESIWSLQQLGHLDCTAPVLTLRHDENRLILSNSTGADLPPQWRLPKKQGYILELVAGSQIWESALVGDYYSIAGYEDISAEEARETQAIDKLKGNYWRPITPRALVVPVRGANRLRFTFASLHAGESLRTGRMVLSTGVPWNAIRYRILPLQPEWKTLQ